MKENYGNLITLKELGKVMKNSFTTEQLLDENLKNTDGESRKEVTLRAQRLFNKVLNENIGKRIAIVSHGATIKFILMKWCNLSDKNELEFDGKRIITNSPGIIKMIFEDNELIQLEQIL